MNEAYRNGEAEPLVGPALDAARIEEWIDACGAKTSTTRETIRDSLSRLLTTIRSEERMSNLYGPKPPREVVAWDVARWVVTRWTDAHSFSGRDERGRHSHALDLEPHVSDELHQRIVAALLAFPNFPEDPNA